MVPACWMSGFAALLCRYSKWRLFGFLNAVSSKKPSEDVTLCSEENMVTTFHHIMTIYRINNGSINCGKICRFINGEHNRQLQLYSLCCRTKLPSASKCLLHTVLLWSKCFNKCRTAGGSGPANSRVGGALMSEQLPFSQQKKWFTHCHSLLTSLHKPCNSVLNLDPCSSPLQCRGSVGFGESRAGSDSDSFSADCSSSHWTDRYRVSYQSHLKGCCSSIKHPCRQLLSNTSCMTLLWMAAADSSAAITSSKRQEFK